MFFHVKCINFSFWFLDYFFCNHIFILHKFDIICLSETYLYSTTPNDDDKLQIPGYTLIRSDHPSNTKRGGVCIYYKSSLPLKLCSDEEQNGFKLFNTRTK